ncbi:[Fe-S]-dependent transcriptional repressor FeoC [Yokenella regensburgei]|uniref:[Fe-S]-dependent transcriptional repressor FeoC n=1 Tax=Yokenella regensburgei TaxID=158877 RepID=UPI003F184740
MASLIDVRNMLALRGRMDVGQLSSALQLSRPMVEAMLGRMEIMGKAIRVPQEAEGCLTGSCKACPEGKTACHQTWWTLSGC